MQNRDRQTPWSRLTTKLFLPALPEKAYFLRYGLAIVLVFLAILSKFLLETIQGDNKYPTVPYLTFIPFIFLTAWYAGLGPGLLATTLSCLAGLYFFLPPTFNWEVARIQDFANLSILISFGLLVSGLIDLLRRVYRQLDFELGEHRRTNKLLDLERERFEVTLRSIGDGVITTGENGRITLLNPLAEKLTGWSQEEARDKPLSDVFKIINETDHRPLENPLFKIFHEGGAANFAGDALLVSKDGRMIPIDDSGAQIRDSTNCVIGAVLTFRDVTERKRVERDIRILNSRLKQKIAELETIFNITPIGLAIAEDPHCQVIKGNPAFFITQNLPPGSEFSLSTWGGKQISRIFLDGFAANIDDLPMMQSSSKGLTFKDQEIDLYFEDGSKKIYLSSTSPLFDEAGSPRGCISSFLDITLRKKEEYNLRYLSEVSKALNASLDFEETMQNLAHIIVPEMADWCTVNILNTDGSLVRLGLAHKDPGVEAALAELTGKYRTGFSNRGLMQTVLETGKTVLLPDYNKDGLEERVSDAALLKLFNLLETRSRITVPLVNQDKVLGVVNLASGTPGFYKELDIPLVEELVNRAAVAVSNARLYQESQKAIEIRENFLMIAAHELKTPLTSVRGFAQLAKREISKEEIDRDRLHRLLTTVENQSNKLTFLVNRLLDYSRLQAGRLVLEYQKTDLKSMIENVAETLQAISSKHTLVVDIQNPVVALLDPLRFEQVLINLVENAIKYSPVGGMVEISLNKTSEKEVLLSIRDQGVGIEPEHREKIFDLFYQAHQNTYSGLGVGLFVSLQIIELHRGRIEVGFPDEGGTCFTIIMPTGLPETEN